MSRPVLLIAAIVAVGAVYVLLPVAADLYWKFRRSIAVRCPETRGPASVKVDARRAVLGGLFGSRWLRLTHCSRWPERRDCDQGCREQIP